MTSGLKLPSLAFAAALFGMAQAGMAQNIETRGGHCNDAIFGSDGGGISACLEYALRYDDAVFGVGLFGVTPELRSNLKGFDPLESLARLDFWYGRQLEHGEFDYALTAHAGIEGGVADDLAKALKEPLHDLFGQGNRKIVSTHDTTFIGGISGWVRRDYSLTSSESWAFNVSPYGHAALGNDVIEGGGGFMLAIQPAAETEGLALVMPKNGAYAPVFGGDGIGMFAGVRGVARDTFYDDRLNHFIAEAGVVAQATLWDFAVIGASASCTTKAYDGTDRPDCKAGLQMGGRF
jgi:hypothetical protein